MDLFQSAPAEIGEVLGGKVGTDIIKSLLQLADKDIVNLVGIYLRMFTDSEYLLDAWLDLDVIRQLLELLKDMEFTTQAEASQTG